MTGSPCLRIQKKKHMDDFTKGKIIALYETKMTLRAISLKVGVHEATVSNFIQRYKKNGTIHRKPGSGRPKILDKNDLKELIKYSEENPTKTSKEISSEMTKLTNKAISSRTVIRNLNENGIFGLNSLPRSVAKMGLNDFVFQQDNAPCHTAKLIMNYFDKENIKTLDWPSQLPDLNPIEHLWAHIKAELSKIDLKNAEELKQELLHIWGNTVNPRKLAIFVISETSFSFSALQ
ncbi:uncharacterized protein LOC115230102 [Octopus sinensis]|uniref:Uncharacterized protein LOC115230102 n=1 Tax=Octopus sinensis TaxID=2607531 RepID=A0A6P7U3U1_9MOLL|nr:uncharacterized protein LOC115230102 [Octopus sinensis]